MRSALCAYSFREALKAKTATYADLIRWAVDWDLDGVDLTVYWFPSTDPGFLLPLRALAYRSGVPIYSISIRTNMCRPTAEQRAAEVTEVRKWVDVASMLGAGHIRVFGGDVPKTSTEKEASGWVVETLKRASDYGASKGVILGLENHGGITSKADTILEIVNAVNSPWVGVNLDTGNFRTQVYEQVEQLAPYAVNVQLKVDLTEDGEKKPADWNRVFTILARNGYKGFVAIEHESKDDPTVSLPKLSKKLRGLVRKYSEG